MKNVPVNVKTPMFTAAGAPTPNNMNNLFLSLAFAVIPFIPGICEWVSSIPDQIAKNGYGLYVKHGQTEVYFNRADLVGDMFKGGGNDEQDA